MRFTARAAGRSKGAGMSIPAPIRSQGSSFPAPVGGWDAYSPISAMPEQNAVQLVNWYPQPGYVELRRGYVTESDTETGTEVETVMAYQGPNVTDSRLFGASGGEIWDCTTNPAISVGSGFTNNRWQYVNMATSGGNFLWMCNGDDTPQYWNGSTLQAATITGVTPGDMIVPVLYRGRIWTVLRNSTKAAYLPLDSIQGAATTFDLGPYFKLGGHLQSIGTWSTDVQGGTNEFIVFVSSYGEVAIFLIYDPGDGSGFSFRGVSTVGSPIGRRCIERIGSDMALITIDGVLPLSAIINYDRAAVQQAALTKNIRNTMVQAARDYQEHFGWEIISYPRNTMAIINVPIAEGGQQEQYVMNTINGAWARFTGQNANCWCVFMDRLYFGGNDGVVYLADEGSGDENSTLVADIQGAYNYFGTRGQNKRWTTIRPLIEKDTSYVIELEMGISTDFNLNDSLDEITSSSIYPPAIWNDPNTIWDDPNTIWPGPQTIQNWMAISGIGYCAAIRMKVTIEWSETLRAQQTLRIYSFDTLFDTGAFI